MGSYFEDFGIYQGLFLERGYSIKKCGHARISAFLDDGYVGDEYDRKSTTGYIVFVEGNLLPWSKKQDVSLDLMQKQSIGLWYILCVNYRDLKNLLSKFSFKSKSYMSMHFDNQSVIYFTQNLVFHIVPNI